MFQKENKVIKIDKDVFFLSENILYLCPVIFSDSVEGTCRVWRYDKKRVKIEVPKKISR